MPMSPTPALHFLLLMAENIIAEVSSNLGRLREAATTPHSQVLPLSSLTFGSVVQVRFEAFMCHLNGIRRPGCY